jgi:hypothetical protein
MKFSILDHCAPGTAKKKEAKPDFLQMKVHFRANLEDLRISHKRLLFFALEQTFCRWPV